MRKSLVALTAAIAVVSAASLVSDRAQAGAFNAAAGLGTAVDETDVATQVDHVCTRVWRCGPFGCGFRSVCGWRPGPYGFYRSWAYRPYSHHYGWGGRPHWRWGW